MKITEVFKTSKFVEYKLLKKQPQLQMEMINRISTSIYWGEVDKYHHQDRGHRFLREAMDFCEKRNQGLWSCKLKTCWCNDKNEIIAEDRDEDVTQSYGLFLFYFQVPEDRDRFQSQFLLLKKLEN
jgi:hypothetical protein